MEVQTPPQPTPPPPHLTFPDSANSSPRSRNTDSWDEPHPPSTTTTTKLRLMCSYGGQIVPRPHDKSLCYVGGDTRIVVVDRQTSLSDLSTRLSKSFLNGLPFLLKYQLPNEDLDSLVSVTTDEDLENMIDEYDHRTSSKPSRIRLFLFPAQPDLAQTVGPGTGPATAKTEDWFLSALNGAGGLSDSGSMNGLLGLDDEEAVAAGVGNNNLTPAQHKNLKQGQEVQSVPDSPMLETNSSFGSTSSSPSVANLPPIKVRVEDGGNGGGEIRAQDQKVVGIEEQFAQLGVGGVVQKQDEGFGALSSPPAVAAISTAATVVVSDDERSENGIPVRYSKPPTSQPQTQSQTQGQTQFPQFQQKSTGVFDLPSPDSVSSDSSLSNPMSHPKPVIYQDQVQIQSGTSWVPTNSVDPKLNVSDQHGQFQMHQQHVQDRGYVLQQQQFDQQQQAQPPQQFIHGTHLIHQHNPAYYTVYQQQQLHPQHHHLLDQQYPVYYVPATQAQAYNLSTQQANVGESVTTTVPSNLPQNLPNPAAMVPSSAAYNLVRNAPLPNSEVAAGAYRLVQVPANQQQQQQRYVAYSQIHHPSQSMAPNSAAPANYAYDYANSAHAQMFYTQPLAPQQIPSQYQTMTAAEVSAQLPSEGMKQQVRL